MTKSGVLGVVGAGAMGRGIAQVGLVNGYRVILQDVAAEALANAEESIRKSLLRMIEKGTLVESETAGIEQMLVTTESLSDLIQCDVVIEAIIEHLEAKQNLFARLEDLVRPDCILATNTSSLSVSAIASCCKAQHRICGLHFFNPVPIMKLVEVIAAPETSDAVIERACELARSLGKEPIEVPDVPGFLVNLQGRAYHTEALTIVQERVSDFATIDRIMRDGAGFRMGPFELMDLTGIDVGYPATTYIYQGFHHEPRLRTTPLHSRMFHSHRFGRKSGQGFYNYSGEAPPRYRQPEPTGRPLRATLVGDVPEWEILRARSGRREEPGITLIAPIGEDCATSCTRLGLDPVTTVAIDFTTVERNHLTVMSTLGGRKACQEIADALRGLGFIVEIVGDSPGFVLQRVLSVIANHGCELAQMGVGRPAEIDKAMRLAQNYPLGPLEWAEKLGTAKCHSIVSNIHEITGSDRYRPSLWLRRRAMLGLSIYAEE